MMTCDALIVGGGPAGSTCAWRLRHAGLDVLVVDAATFPRDKVCAGWITPQVVTALRLDTSAYAASGRTFQPITGFRVGLIDGRDATRVAYDRPASFGIRRCEFDHYLRQRAGARLRLGARITSIRKDGRQWIVNDAIRAPLLVGAGGSGCPVARMLDGGRDRPVVVAREAEERIGDADRTAIATGLDVPELFFCRDLQGYGWCVRKGQYLNVGLGRLDQRSLPAATDHFLSFLEKTDRIPPHVPWRWRGHSYAVHTIPPRRMIDDGVMLIGDAAGVADPRSGEGIRQAIESGLLAADTIVDANGGFTRDRLEPYAAAVMARFGAPSFSGAVTRLVPDALKTLVAWQLLRVPAFVKRVVIDDWFLHSRQSVLAH
jgi:flavin-dependent dehydrogenase